MKTTIFSKLSTLTKENFSEDIMLQSTEKTHYLPARLAGRRGGKGESWHKMHKCATTELGVCAQSPMR